MHDTRLSFHRTMEVQFRDLVEKTTGRRVLSYMSQVHEGPDIAAEIFVLEPEDAAG